MSYCLNFDCQNPHNLDRAKICYACGAELRLDNRYLALQLIGQNRFSRTFLAIDRSQPNKSFCVIKQGFPQKETALFQQKAVLLKALGQHDQIPTLLDAFEHEGYQYLIEEFIDGENLAKELESDRFSEIKVCSLLLDLLPVLEFVHQHQVIYRDIKPKNIIRRTGDRKLCLIDFETAKLSVGKAFLETETIVGSAAYASPEQLLGKATFTSDLYSLGITCIHLLTQVEPFNWYPFAARTWVWQDYLHTPVSQSLGVILDKFLESDLGQRYDSAAAALQDVRLIQTRATLTKVTDYMSEAAVPKRLSLVSKKNLISKKLLVSKKHLLSLGDRASKLFAVNQQLCTDLNQFYGRIFVAASAFFLSQIPSAYQSEIYFRDHAISAIGTVKQTTAESYWISTGISAGYLKTEYTSLIQFETLKGKAVIFSTSSAYKTAQVPILYDPIYPKQARIRTAVNPKNAVYGHLIVSALLALVATLILSTTRSQRK